MHDLADLHAGDARGQGLSEIAEPQAHPAHEVFVIKHTDDVLGTALRVVDRDAGVLAFDHAGQGFVEQEIGGKRKNIRARDHDLANGDAVEFDGVVDHFFLERGNLAELAAGGDDQLEFVGRMNGASAAGLAGAEDPQNQAAGAAHEKKNGTGEGEEGLHGRGDGEGDLLGALQGQSLRDQFAEDDVHIGDQAEGDGDGDGVGVDGGVRDFFGRTPCIPRGGRPWVRRSSPESG